MKYLAIFLACFMLVGTASATITPPGNPDLCEQNPGNPHCHDDDDGGEGNGGNGGNGGNADVVVDNTNTNTNDNTNTQGQQQGQIQGQIATGGDATATGGEGGDAYAGAAIIIGGGSQGECYEGECEGGSAPFSNNNEIDNSSTATTGDQTTTITDNSFDGGNTLIIGGGQGECYEGECEGGGTLTSNAENNVDVSNDSSSTSAANSESNNDNDNSNSNDVNNDVDVVVEGDHYEAADIPVNSAPPSFAAICSSGMAGSGSKVSLSFAVTSDVCTALMMADAYNAVGDIDEVNYWLKRAAKHARWKGNVGLFRTVITIGIL